MKTISINIPEEFDLKKYDLLMLLAAKLYEEGKLSAGQAAVIAEVSKRTFIELLGRYGVSVFGTSVADLNSDITNA